MPKKAGSPKARLKTYRAKRNFKVTPEPSGDEKVRARASTPPAKEGAEKPASRKTSQSLFFCVQKHLASHLHYDFRLEHAGVLLSWAVPKGPSLNPADKRLAMRVEDHPYDYGEFEGVIPEGYGAGIVMLWDRGEWIPEVDDVEAALVKGDLKFRLEGVKLKGSWVLVRTRPRGEETESRSWLLIKHRDDWAGPIDVTQEAPLSVRSGSSFEEILAAGNPDVWESHRPAAGGAAGKMLAEIIERAIALRGGKVGETKQSPAAARRPAKKTRPSARKSRKPSSRR